MGTLDIISRLGGYMGSLLPVIRLSAPVFLMYYLYQLSDVMRNNGTKEWFEKSKNFLEEVQKSLILCLNMGMFKKELVELINMRLEDIEKVLAIVDPQRKNLKKGKQT